MNSDPIPHDFQQTIHETFGEAGAAWLERLPGLIAACERRWGLRVGAPFELSYNYVVPATMRDGTPVVLKLGVPDREFSAGVEALRRFGGDGAVRLLEAAPAEGILLMERLQPGTPLEALPDDRQATGIAVRLMRRLWRPVSNDSDLIPLVKWTAGLKRLRKAFDGGSGPFPDKMVGRAEGLFAELNASASGRALLHGDLHYWNILSARREPWLAIDPKGLVGDPAFEPAAWLLNPRPRDLKGDELRRQLHRRIDQFADELGLDRGRMLAWGYAQAVLSAWWSYEDHGRGWEHALAIAQALGE